MKKQQQSVEENPERNCQLFVLFYCVSNPFLLDKKYKGFIQKYKHDLVS
jgi:hypothetical protein